MAKVIVGLDSLMRKLSSMGGKVNDALTNAVYTTTLAALGDAKALVPVDTGELKASITVDVTHDGTGATGKVYTNNDHAIFVELGTGPKGQASHSGSDPGANPTYTLHSWSYKKDGVRKTTSGQAAQPYLYPAAKQNESVFQGEATKELLSAIRRMGG